MADYFADDPKPTDADGTDYFTNDPIPTAVGPTNIATVSTTGKGGDTSMIPIEGGDFFSLVKSYGSRAGYAMMPIEAQAKSFEQEGEDSGGVKAQTTLDKTIELYKNENSRIDNVLFDIFGTNYSGADSVGDISLNVRDGLARRNKFSDRNAYFKEQYPEGKYYRTNVGGSKTEELYQLSKDGPIYRVDPNGGFSDFTGDFGDFLGTVGNFSTAGSIAGSFFMPFWGTAGGSLMGQMLDDYLTDEGVDTSGGKEFWGGIFSWDKALMATVEGGLNKFAPGMGKWLLAKIMREETGVPLNFATKKTAREALDAQKFAQKSGLPLLSIAQLTDNNVIKKLANQLAGTSDLITKKMTKQNLAIFNKLKNEVDKGYDSVSQTNIVNYLNLFKKKLIDDTVTVVKGADKDSQVGDINLSELIGDVNKFKEGYDVLIDKTFTLAMQTAKKDKVVFNLGDIRETAENLMSQVQIKMAKPDAKGNNVYQRIGGELNGDIGALLNQLRKADENVGTIAVETFGTRRTYDAVKQMLTVRNKLQEIAGEAGDKNAIAMIKAIDKTLESPMNGGTEFLKHLGSARKLVKDKSDIVNFTSLASLFDRSAGLNGQKTMEAIFNGNMNATDINILAKFMQVAEGVTDKSGKQVLQKSQAKVMKNLQDGVIQTILESGENAGKVLSDFKINKPALYEKLVPHAPTRKALEDLSLKSSQLQNSGAQKALAQAMENSENAFALLAGSTAKEVNQMIAQKGGVNGKFASDLRRSILNKIMTKSNIVEQAEGSGKFVLNTPMFSKELTDVNNGLGEYANFKSLFPQKYTKALEDRRLYSLFVTGGTQADAGAGIATGAVVGKLRQGEPIAFAKTMFISNLLSSFLSKAPSVVQLQKIHDTQPLFGRRDKVLGAMTAILTSIERELDIPGIYSPATGAQETLLDETERTGDVPETGDPIPPVSSNSITPNTLNLNLPAVSPSGSSGPPTTNYASLFPFDTTGGAIQSRAGIGGLV